MAARLLALFAILIGASMSWETLTGVLATRTAQADSDQQADLGSLWGPEQTQGVPRFSVSENKRWKDVSIDATTITTGLHLEQRRKGLLWHNTYLVDFSADYRVAVPSSRTALWLDFPLPSQDAVYDDVRVLVDGAPVTFSASRSDVTAVIPMYGCKTTATTV